MSKNKEKLLTKKFNIFGTSLTIANILELIGGLLVILFVSTILTQEATFGRPRAEWFRYFLAAQLGALLGIPLIMIIFGKNDYRFRMSLHSLILASEVIIYSAILDALDIYNSKYTLSEFMILILPWFTILMITGIGVIFSLYSETHIYFDELRLATDAFSKGQFDYRVTNKRVLEDTVFSIIGITMNEIMNTTQGLVQNLNATTVIINATHDLSATTQQVNESTEHVASTSQSMSTVASEQANNVHEISQKLQLLDDSIHGIVEKIKKNSEGVSQIALQTNILALNAGIEASRAGDYGRGFAVVAENVRKLSDESKKAAENIIAVSNDISESLQITFNDIRLRIDDISALSEETAASAEEVASVAEEMTSSMEELNASTAELAEFADKAKEFVESEGLDYLMENK